MILSVPYYLLYSIRDGYRDTKFLIIKQTYAPIYPDLIGCHSRESRRDRNFSRLGLRVANFYTLQASLAAGPDPRNWLSAVLDRTVNVRPAGWKLPRPRPPPSRRACRLSPLSRKPRFFNPPKEGKKSAHSASRSRFRVLNNIDRHGFGGAHNGGIANAAEEIGEEAVFRGGRLLDLISPPGSILLLFSVPSQIGSF